MDPEKQNTSISRAKEIFYNTLERYLSIFPYGQAFSTEERGFIRNVFKDIGLNDEQHFILEAQRLRDTTQTILTIDFPVHYDHMISSAILAVKLGREYGLDYWNIVRNAKGVVLHDVGKFKQKGSLLYGGHLTPEEKRKMEDHVIDGVSLVYSTGEEDLIVHKTIFEHQMYITDPTTGSTRGGYPDKRNSEQPGIYGRIAAISDSTDAMIHGRHYRLTKELRIGSLERAIDELTRCSKFTEKEGQQFDLKLAKSMITFLEYVKQS